MVRTAFAALALIAAAPAAMAEEAPSTVNIKEWSVPWENTRPRDPFAESATSIWFVGQRGGYLGHLNAETSEFTKVDLGEGAGPHNQIVDENGIVWIAGNRNAYIGRYDPETEDLEKIPMPDPAARDPHTLIQDAAGDIWFTVQGGNFMGKLTVETRQVDLVPSKTQGSRPYGIKIAPDGTVWVVLFGSYKLVKIDPETLEATEIDLPREAARPRRLDITSDGRIWYGDYAEGKLGVYDPAAETFKEWDLPSGSNARPYAMAVDSQDRIWVVETGISPNMFVGFDPETEKFFSQTPVPSNGGTLRHMHYHEPSGAIWFGADTNTIGRAIVEPNKAEPQ